MANGGKRPGAGRRKGIPNKASAARERAVAASGDAPLDVLLRAMRSFQALADESKKNKRLFVRYMTAAAAVAKDAAGWVHPRIVARGRATKLALPEIKSASDIVAAMSIVTSAMSSGDLSPAEAVEIGAVVELTRKALSTNQHETRLAALEQLAKLEREDAKL
jgi:tRNA A37 threonylcarbamoyladenosine synthetase subunit TsaC/SUA5/YrdC